jgi:uroporphyrin-3 C-methyltransferase/uroporphyrinogen III methyltransferase/synthase
MSAPPPAPVEANDSAAPPAADAAAADEAALAAAQPERPRRMRQVVLGAVALLLVALAATALWRIRTDVDVLRSRVDDVPRLLAAGVETGVQRDREAQLKIEQLESEVERLRNQREELNTLYLDLTRGRDEAALVEVERLVTLAAQELQITGNVPTALAALQTADARLGRIDRPQLVALRRAVNRDIERLRAVPAVDFTGLAVKLDQLATSVDNWPLLAEAAARPASESKPAESKAGKPAPKKEAAASPVEDWWSRMRAWLKDEFGDLVRIREVDTPEALLLTAQQQQLARQQMRLRLLAARQALLTRNDRLFRSDMAEALVLVNRYFDTRSIAVSSAAGQLKTLAGSTLSVDVPQLAESIAALRQARPAAR